MAYKLEQEWKDPKKRNRNIMIGLALGLIICYGYYNCWFGGPKPIVYDFDWCPSSCLVASGFSSGGTSSAGGSCGSCTDGSSCDCPESSCETCTPPDNRLPCGMNGDENTCGGYCPALYECQSMRLVLGDYTNDYGYCACIPTLGPEYGDERYCGMEAGQCNGACEIGYTCQPYGDYSCQCLPEVTPCYHEGDRTCGGGCESPYETCTYDAKYENCYCISNLN